MADVQIQFTTIPANFLIPGVGIETSTINANSYIPNPRTLIISQMLSNGTATVNVPFLATSPAQVAAATGQGSLASYDYNYYSNVDKFGEVWILPVADTPGGVAATQVVTITGTATSAGTFNLYVLGDNQAVGVQAGDTANVVATNIVTAINTGSPLPVTASQTGGVITITSRHKGVAAADIDVRMNYIGAAGGEVTPAGLTVAFAAGVTGTTDPDLTLALANLGTKTFDYVASAYNNATQTTALQNVFADSNGRWSYLSQLFGGAFNAVRGTVGTLQTFGAGVNNQHITSLGYFDAPEPAHIWAMGYTATCANSLRVDPGVPLQYLVMPMLPPPPQSRFGISQRNTLLYTGVSTFKVNDANQVVLERAVTNYQSDPGTGLPSNAYRDVETLYCLAAYYRNFIQDMMTKFARKKLVADGTTIPNGSPNFVTAQTIRNEAILNYKTQAKTGLVSDVAKFSAECFAQNQGNGRIAITLPVIVCGQLRRIDAVANFYKT